MHATAPGGSTDTVKESAQDVDSGQKNPLPLRGLEFASALRLAFKSDALPTEPSPVRRSNRSQMSATKTFQSVHSKNPCRRLFFMTQTHTLEIFGVIPFVKLQNDT